MILKEVRRSFFFILAFFLIMAGCHGAYEFKTERYSETRSLMATYALLDVCLDQDHKDEAAAAYQEAWQRLEDISWRMNVYDERSDVTKVNQSYGRPVTIGADTYKVIKDAVDFYYRTKGAFDITVWPLIELWEDGEKKGVIPSQEEIAYVKEALGVDKIHLLAGNTVELLHPRTKIDLGGIAAGYALDETAGIFRRHGLENFYFDIGGDIYAGGHNCQGKAWRIGIRDPRDSKQIIDIVALADKGITTSGNYQHYYKINHQRWSHIMNTITGYPQQGVVSATVIAPTAEDADVLATALCVLGQKAGVDVLQRFQGEYASLVVFLQDEEDILKSPSRLYKKFQAKN